MYNGRNREREADNGFIYPIFNKLISVIYYLNIVEFFKWLTVRIVILLYKNATDENLKKRKIRRAQNHSIDFFIVFKFLYLFYVIYFHKAGLLFLLIAIYLLIINVFIYFYYHIWVEGAIKGEHFTVHRTRRRFINLLQSVFYMQMIYAYLYQIPFNNYFSFKGNTNSYIGSLLFSFSNSFPFNFDLIKAVDLTGHIIVLSQVFFSFIFLTIVLTQSIPKANS